MHVDSITSFLKVEWNSLPEIENLIQGALKCCVCVCICVCVLCKNTFFPFLPFKKLASIEDQEGGWCQDYLEVGPLVAAETITLLVWSQECLTSPAKSPLPKPPKSKNVIVSKGKMITPVQIGFQGKKHPERFNQALLLSSFFSTRRKNDLLWARMAFCATTGKQSSEKWPQTNLDVEVISSW